MLKSRSMVVTLSGETLEVAAISGCPQLGFLSPMMWYLVMNGLLEEPKENGYYAIGYADDIVILINRNFPSIISDILQTALGVIEQCCVRTDLSINPSETVVVAFTTKRVLKGLKEPTLFAKTIQLSTEVK
jgi:hypothetical protein